MQPSARPVLQLRVAHLALDVSSALVASLHFGSYSVGYFTNFRATGERDCYRVMRPVQYFSSTLIAVERGFDLLAAQSLT